MNDWHRQYVQNARVIHISVKEHDASILSSFDFMDQDDTHEILCKYGRPTKLMGEFSFEYAENPGNKLQLG